MRRVRFSHLRSLQLCSGDRMCTAAYFQGEARDLSLYGDGLDFEVCADEKRARAEESARTEG